MNRSEIADEIGGLLDRPVVLTGMMGVGKSHLGRLLAEELAVPFVDSDRLIEEEAGCTIAEIFARDGEARFRAAEKKTILALLDGEAKIVATGGGALMDKDTLDAVLARSVSVWIKADPEVLASRLEKTKDRPLLSGGDVRATLDKLLAAREPVYRRADIAVDTTEGSLPRAVDDILAALREFLNR